MIVLINVMDWSGSVLFASTIPALVIDGVRPVVLFAAFETSTGEGGVERTTICSWAIAGAGANRLPKSSVEASAVPSSRDFASVARSRGSR
jgi:hypothetical protein